MKRILLIAALLAGAYSLAAQQKFENYPLPSNPDTLRILAIGNSFSDDGTAYLPDLLEAAGIHNVIVGRLYIGGCSLERHCNEYRNNTNAYTYYKSTDNKWVTVKERNGSMLDGLKDEPWDIITMQETSGYSGVYENHRIWLPQLVSIVRKEAANPKATIAWHRTWAYAANSDHVKFPLYDKDQDRMYAAIGDCVSRLSEEFNIPVIIPSGVAIQIARDTKVNNAGKVPLESKVYDLTRDGYHLSYQFGRYIAACTWFEALVKPTLGKSVKGNGYLLLDTNFAITPSQARICQKAAVKAVKQTR